MLLSETSTTGKKEYSYDEYLRLNEVRETVLTDGKSFTFGYEYDFYGRLAKEIYPHATGETENSTLEYKYDDYGYPVKKYLGITLIWEAKQYAEQGQLSSYTLSNNLTVTKTFDNQGRLTNITSAKGNTSYQNMSYGYRGDGNMHYRTDAISGVNKKEWFKYDIQNRLIGWETTSLNAAEPEYQTRISYEGNRISQKENIGNYAYSGFPHHGVKNSGVTTITNNALDISYDHNMIDGRARVSSIISGNNSVTYTHGTSDELIKKTETKNGNTYTTYYAGGGKYELRIDNNNAETKLLYLGSGVVKYDAPGTTDDKMLYLLKDHLGSVVKVLSINGNTVTSLESFSYDVWGNRRNPITWENTNITTPTYIYKGFTGHEHIEGFGLIHMKGRVYDPALGLFLSPDPYVQSMTAQGFNRYSYCMGNPLMYTDPDGEWVHLVLGAVVGGLFNWIANGAEFSMRGLGYFGVGALSGMLGAGIGSGVNALFIEGGTFANGFVGKGIVESAVGFIAGGASSAAGGTVGSFITGFGNGLLGKEKFKDALLTGTINAGIGGGLGFITGGIAGGIAAKSQGKHFGDGSIRTKDVLVEQQIKSTVQDGDFDCTFANIVATSNGMENQAALRTQYAPFTDKNKDGVNTYFVTKKYAKDMGLSFEFVNLHKDPMSAVEIAEKMNAGANLILSIGEESGIGHTWTVKSITNETIIKQNGKVISKNIYTMLDTRTGNFYSFPNHNARAAFFIGIK